MCMEPAGAEKGSVVEVSGSRGGGGGSRGAVTLELELALEEAGTAGPVGTDGSMWW